MFVRRPIALVVTALSLLTLAAGCASATDAETDGEASGEALSANVCQGKANTKKAAAKKSCEEKDFKFGTCVKPADDAIAAASKALDEERKRIEQEQGEADTTYTAIREQCIADADAVTCAKLLDDNTNAGAFMAASFSAGHPTTAATSACAAKRVSRKSSCITSAADQVASVKAQFDNDPAFKAAKDKLDSAKSARTTDGVSCWVSGAIDKVGEFFGGDCDDEADDAYKTEFNSCRKICPVATHEACSPPEYKGRTVICGSKELSQTKTLFTGKTTTCESELVCKRTAVCDQFDAAAKEADDCPTGKKRVFHPEFTQQKVGNATVNVVKRIVRDCVEQ